MPKPPMKENIIIFEPIGDADKYGRRNYSQSNSKARVAYTTKTIENKEGTKFVPILEVDLPSTTKVGYGYLVEWKDRFGNVLKDSIVGIQEVLNFNGNKVYYRTVYIGKG